MLVLIAIIAEIIMAISIGVGISFIIKDENTSAALLNAFIPVVVFLGGNYFPIEQFNSSVLNTLAKVSPIKWTNDAIFNIIYNNNSEFLFKAVAINLLVALIFIFISSIKFRKEAA